MNFVTDLADQAVVLPLAAIVAIVLLLQRRWRVAGAWVSAIVCVLGVLLVLKLASFACGWRLPLLGPGGIEVSSPSGHTGAAAVTFGGLAGLMAARSRLGVGMAVLIAAAAAGIVIGITRVLLGAHSVAEVVVGFVIGMAGAGLFAWLAGREEKPRSALPVLAAILVLVCAHGARLQAEPMLHGTLAAMVRQWVSYCEPDRDFAGTQRR